MKLFKKLERTAREMTDAVIGFDVFRCADYSAVDGAPAKHTNVNAIRSQLIMGYTIILAANIGKTKFFKRLFIRI